MKELKFTNKSTNKDPEYAHVGDSGFDLRAWISPESGAKEFRTKEDGSYCTYITPSERMLIHTGLYFNIPEDCEIQIRPRSGLALKKGITVLNTPGTIDKNYTNEICVILFNTSASAVCINDGDRIAQAVLMPVYNKENVNLVSIPEVEENEYRNKNGFGSSGVE